jgi:transcriptional regulator with XRE-family HTH domain
MIERIIAILKEKNISPSRFADEIGVQRSSISHLMAGRNKPSLEFVQKIIARYPEIRIEWLLNGSGSMTKDGPLTDDIALTPDSNEKSTSQKVEDEPVKQLKERKKRSPGEVHKELEKIVYFFRDNTFREYFPEK